MKYNEWLDTLQSVFVLGRLITNNALIAFENFHFLNKKGRGRLNYISRKLDISKN